MSEKTSKPLGSEDVSAVEFVKEMLHGDPTYGINFDRIQWNSEEERYVIVEFLLCEEWQCERGITPYTSHPNRYFHYARGGRGNAQKFISLWKIAQDLKGVLYLVNYAKKGTKYDDEILLMEVVEVNKEDEKTPVITKDTKFTRAEFSNWFRELNNKGSKRKP